MDSLNAMEIFVRVVQAGSFSAAARGMELTPSAVSKQIGRLEDRLGARLLNRTTRQLSLTEVGRGYFARASRIITDVAEAEQSVADQHGAPRGLLRVSLPFAFGQLHIVPEIPAFLERYPEVRIELTFNDRFVNLVEEGQDVAIRIGELSDSSLIARRLAANRRLVCGAPRYLETFGRPATPEALTEHNCLVYSYRAPRHEWPFEREGGERQVVQVGGNLETNTAEALYDMALSGVGLALLPLWYVGRDLDQGRLVEVLSDYHVPDNAIYAVYPPGRHLSPKVRAFVDMLAERFDGRECWYKKDKAA